MIPRCSALFNAAESIQVPWKWPLPAAYRGAAGTDASGTGNFAANMARFPQLCDVQAQRQPSWIEATASNPQPSVRARLPAAPGRSFDHQRSVLIGSTYGQPPPAAADPFLVAARHRKHAPAHANPAAAR